MISEYVNYAFQSVGHILSQRINLGVEPGCLLVKRSHQSLGDVTTVTSIYGDHFHLSMALAFNEATIMSISTDFTGDFHYYVDESVIDVAGIVTTMIANEFKKRLRRYGFNTVVKHPNVLCGYDKKILHPFNEPCLILPINTELGIVFLETCIQAQEFCLQECG